MRSRRRSLPASFPSNLKKCTKKKRKSLTRKKKRLRSIRISTKKININDTKKKKKKKKKNTVEATLAADPVVFIDVSFW